MATSFCLFLIYVGIHSRIIVPPSWIVKLPRKGSFKSSLRKTPKKKPAGKKKSKEKELKTFVIKPIPTPNITPVLVFINPKSGGNQGAKLLQKFQWLLNPRQVFDLTQGGPRLGYVICYINFRDTFYFNVCRKDKSKTLMFSNTHRHSQTDR